MIKSLSYRVSFIYQSYAKHRPLLLKCKQFYYKHLLMTAKDRN